MGTIANLLVKLGLDSADYSSGLDAAERQAQTKAKNIGAALGKIGSQMTGVGKTMSLGMTAPIVGGFALAINSASDLNETVSKSNVVFGDMADQVQMFAEGASSSLGMSNEQALAAASTYGNLFVSMGMSAESTADMSTGLVQLAADLASFNNMDPTEVMEKLRAGLTGETEPLKSFGVNLNAAAVTAKAASMGLVTFSVDATKVADMTIKANEAQEKYNKAVGWYGANSSQAQAASVDLTKAQEALAEAQRGSANDLSASAKAQATYALIMEQTATAQGDFARTSDGLANSTRSVKAQLADAAAQIGTMLLPIAQKLVNAISQVITWFTNLSPSTQRVIVIVLAVVAAIGPLLMIIGSLISAIGAILPVIGAVVGIFSGPVLLIIGLVVGAIALLAAAWNNNWFGIRDTLTNIWNGVLMPIFDTVKTWLQVNIPIAIQALSDFWNNTLLPALNAVWSFISTYILPIFQAIIEIATTLGSIVLTALAGFWQNVLQPALEKVWNFLSTNILPIIKEVADFISAKMGPQIELLGKLFSGLAATLSGGVRSALTWLHDKLDKIASFLKNFKLPDWLTPGSPTPFELGLWGIVEAMDTLNRSSLPQFNANISGMGTLTPAYASTSNDNRISIGSIALPGVRNPDDFIQEISRKSRNARMGGAKYITR